MRRGGVVRELRSLPIGGKPVRLRMTVARVLCRTCFAERQVPVGFADPKKPCSHEYGHEAVRALHPARLKPRCVIPPST